MTFLKVKGYSGLVRDMLSNAIINTNKNDYELYMARAKQREEQRDLMTDTIKEINSLKKDLFEIKEMIKEKG